MVRGPFCHPCTCSGVATACRAQQTFRYRSLPLGKQVDNGPLVHKGLWLATGLAHTATQALIYTQWYCCFHPLWDKLWRCLGDVWSVETVEISTFMLRDGLWLIFGNLHEKTEGAQANFVVEFCFLIWQENRRDFSIDWMAMIRVQVGGLPG